MSQWFNVSILSLCLLAIPLATLAKTSEIEGFNQRMKRFETIVAQRVNDRPALVNAYNNLEDALTQEMDRAFDMVMTKTDAKRRNEMNKAQQQWAEHRASEYTWMDAAHGPIVEQSDEHVKVLQLRNLMMNARVLQLYSYLDTLPELTEETTFDNLVPRTDVAIADDNDLKIATIRGFSLGEGACFLDLVDEKRKPFTEVASAAFCQRERELLDKRVSLTYRLGVVPSAACAVESVTCVENNMLILVSNAQVIRPKR
ncbi:MAG: hypothetical protein ACPG47_02955 [Leucothrix sp.]